MKEKTEGGSLVKPFEMRVRITFVEEILGTAASDRNIHEAYIASKAPDKKSKEEEVAAIGVEEFIERSMTVFPRNAAGEKVLWGYQLKGAFKSAQKVLNALTEKKAKLNMPAYKGKIDTMIFIKSVDSSWDDPDRGLVIHIPEGKKSEDCQRPLRAETAQGPRVALAHSETCPAGSWVEFDVMSRNPSFEPNIRQWLDDGRYYGIGQWRNSGKGRYRWEEIPVK